ncbi:MAG: DUF488 domain-containing protein [candidate division Zixibacteria bacterium]|nr:DUF488 domain-containing protein [candidate division Zixibacteria bacterium]
MKLKDEKIHTIGYQGRSIGSFIEILSENLIDILVDIREKPYSRIKDFSSKKLAAHLAGTNIEYLHLPRLGSSQNLRHKVRSDHDYDYFFKEYNKYLSTQSNTLTDLYNLSINKTICLMCVESDYNICHRRSVAEKLLEFSGKEGTFSLNHL